MPRPVEYDQERVDTKVRLRPDHARLLREASIERSVGRNRLVEMALDQFFGITPTGPRLGTPPKDPDLTRGSRREPSRVTPRVRSAGSAMEAASAARTPRRAP